MSRPRHPRTNSAVVRRTSGNLKRDLRLRAELQVRLDQLRAAIESKRRAGWTVVRSPAPDPDQPL